MFSRVHNIIYSTLYISTMCMLESLYCYTIYEVKQLEGKLFVNTHESECSTVCVNYLARLQICINFGLITLFEA